MSHRGRFWIGCVIVLFSCRAAGDEWGTWNDLPSNLLESEQGVHSLDELSRQLDRLIQQNRDVEDGMRQQLLRHWLDQISADTLDTVSLDRLLEISEDWDDDDLSKWQDDLEDFLEDQADLLEDRQDDLEDVLDDNHDDSDELDDPDVDVDVDVDDDYADEYEENE